jgi:hypothetical protein
MRKLLVTTIAALSLSACATTAQRELAHMEEGGSNFKSHLKTCVAPVMANEEYREINAKLPPLEGSTVPMSVLVNQQKPIEAEAALLLKRHADLEPCRRQAIDDANKVNAAYGAALISSYTAADADFIRLVKREETWGEFAQGSQQRASMLVQQGQQITDNINQHLQQSHAAEVQHRQAAFQSLSQWGYQQQVIAAMNRPVSTNCVRTGTVVNCTSY